MVILSMTYKDDLSILVFPQTRYVSVCDDPAYD